MSAPELNDDARAALQLIPWANEIAEFVKTRIPPGLDYGVFILVPGRPEGRVIALTSNRDRVAPQVAQWVLNTLGPTT